MESRIPLNLIGQTLSHFKITAKLGEGGMGEVWRAEDSKLGREVAIKVLPEAFTEDAERLARFEREARVLASLNHPNIAGIHEVGEDNGVHFLAMELVEGEDLAERLERGPLELEEAISVALQIVEALESAHENGVIHRDLKPQNIKLTPEANVKVLDFGLAKAFDPAGPTSGGAAPQLTHSPTMTLNATVEGVILGTAAYMAPEQAKGQMADKRADIWAFGVVLWEMLSGSRLFSAETAPETLAKVLTFEVDPAAAPDSIPPSVQRLLRRCLQRDPRKRLRDIGDARWDLFEAKTEPISRLREENAKSRSSWLPWAVAATVVVAALLAWLAGGISEPATPAGGLLKVRYAQLRTVDDSNPRPFFLSPQGDRMVIEAPGRLLLRDRRSLDPTVLVDDLAASRPAPFWSPDGRWVAYESGGKLWKVPVLGGAPKMICSVPNNYSAGAWGADDRIVFVLTRGAMFTVSALGGNPELLLPREEGVDIDFHQPTFLPDGRSLLYSVHRPSGVDTIELLTAGGRNVVYRLEGELRLDPQVLNAPIYSATGHIVYRRDAGDKGVWALPFSLEEPAILGDPFLVAGGGRWPSLSSDGRLLAYAEAATDSLSRLVQVAMDGSSSAPTTDGMPGVRRTSISPSGERIAFSAEVGSSRELFVTDLEGTQVQLTGTPESEDSPSWSPDGKTLFFHRGTGEGTAIFRMPVDGHETPEKVIDRASSPVVSSSGRRILFSTNGRSTLGIGYYDLEAAEETFLLALSSDFGDAQLSPDERVLAYVGYETGQDILSLRSFPDGATSLLVPGSGETGFAWGPDSKTLYYWHSLEPKVLAIDVVSEPHLVVSPPRVVLDLDAVGLARVQQDSLAVFPDGKSFLMVQPMRAGDGPGDIILVENWLEEFERSTDH